MTQPPEDQPPADQPPADQPPEDQPAEPWQAPGPAPGQYPAYPPPYDVPPPAPPSGPGGPPPPPPGQNPYGGGTVSYYQPIESGGMSNSLKVVLGVVIGLAGGFFLWFVALIAFSGGGDDAFFLAAVAPLLVPAPLLIWRATRPWAAGLLIGVAVSSIGLSSLCSALLSGVGG